MGSGGARAGLTGLFLVLAGAAGADCAPGTLALRGPDGAVAQFSVEVADEPDERAQGLMFRKTMPSSTGMLFVYTAPQRSMFWMRNTLIPLDMVFMDAAGRVTRVHSDAVPLDETPIDGGTGVRYVLEINGGLAKRLGIAPGHEMRHPAVEPSVAAWPCGAE